MEFTLNTRHETRDQWTGFPSAVESLIRARTADAIFVVDPEYRVVHWDARAESLTGFLAEEVVGRPCYEVVSAQGGTGDCFDARVRSAMKLARTGQPVPGYDVRVLTRTSGRRWVNLSTLVVDSEWGPYLVHPYEGRAGRARGARDGSRPDPAVLNRGWPREELPRSQGCPNAHGPATRGVATARLGQERQGHRYRTLPLAGDGAQPHPRAPAGPWRPLPARSPGQGQGVRTSGPVAWCARDRSEQLCPYNRAI